MSFLSLLIYLIDPKLHFVIFGREDDALSNNIDRKRHNQRELLYTLF